MVCVSDTAPYAHTVTNIFTLLMTFPFEPLKTAKTIAQAYVDCHQHRISYHILALVRLGICVRESEYSSQNGVQKYSDLIFSCNFFYNFSPFIVFLMCVSNVCNK